jgi:hypothetical protein
VFFQRHAHLRVGAQELGQVVGQKTVRGVRVGPQADMAAHALGVGGEVGVHLFELGEHLAGVTQQGLAGAGEGDATGTAGEQRRADGLFEQAHAVAGRGGGEVRPLGAARQVLRFGDGHEEAKVGEIVAHGFLSSVR